MVFDNLIELEKIRRCYPDAQLVLRIAVDDAKSALKLGAKFGAKPNQIDSLLHEAKSMGLNVVSVSFHAGSCSSDADQYRQAIKAARDVFDEAADLGFKLNLLDLGGGFPGRETGVIALSEIASTIEESLATYFQKQNFPGLKVIAEPGRYFARRPFSLAVSITSKRVELSQHDDGSLSKTIMYYLNDGTYGSFGGLSVFDPPNIVEPIILTQHGRWVNKEHPPVNEGLHMSTLWGPSCDSADIVMKDVVLPELDVGDWLWFGYMGAYTMSMASDFNGFPRTNVIYINS